MRRSFIITGSSKGLGEALVSRLLSDKDIKVLAVSREVSDKHIGYSPSQFSHLKYDLYNNNLNPVFEFISNKVDSDELVFINNASQILPINTIGNFNDEEIEKIIRLNVNTPIKIVNFLINRYSHKKLIFLNISSGAASLPICGWSLYCSTKSSIKTFFEVAEKEYEQHTFFNIDPGVIDTGMQNAIRNSTFEKQQDFMKMKSSGSLQTPDEAALKIVKKYL
jgi:benzil reductase ((S)-benzoin forming)